MITDFHIWGFEKVKDGKVKLKDRVNHSKCTGPSRMSLFCLWFSITYRVVWYLPVQHWLPAHTYVEDSNHAEKREQAASLHKSLPERMKTKTSSCCPDLRFRVFLQCWCSQAEIVKHVLPPSSFKWVWPLSVSCINLLSLCIYVWNVFTSVISQSL